MITLQVATGRGLRYYVNAGPDRMLGFVQWDRKNKNWFFEPWGTTVITPETYDQIRHEIAKLTPRGEVET